VTLSHTNQSRALFQHFLSSLTGPNLQDEATFADCERAAQQGAPIAQVALAQMHGTRRANPRDLMQACMWYLIASEKISRQASPSDLSLMIRWTRAFQNEIGESANDTERRVDRGLAAGQLWVWDQNGESTSMAVGREPAQRVVRLSGVYTPPERRKHGYATACVHALSKHFRGGGYRCILYTDLGNPTSNPIYRRIGYRAVAEALCYRWFAKLVLRFRP